MLKSVSMSEHVSGDCVTAGFPSISTATDTSNTNLNANGSNNCGATLSQDPEKRICRFYNTINGCWNGKNCKFLHITDQKPPCKYYLSSCCKFGENCHFSHDLSSLSADMLGHIVEDVRTVDENCHSNELIGTNNNSMEAMMNSQLGNLLTTLPEGKSDHNECIVRETVTSVADFRYCGACKKQLKRRDPESYCTVLKDHYLECFLEKEPDHIKYVSYKTSLEPSNLFWCKTCIMVFDKPWSLFQHMADKSTGSRLSRCEKTAHHDWLDTVAGLLAGSDLGIFNPGKLRTDLHHLMTDQNSIDEELETAAMTAYAAIFNLLAPVSNPWRIQKRDMLRQVELWQRHFLRRCMNGSIPTGVLMGLNALASSTFAKSLLTSTANNVVNNEGVNSGSLPIYATPLEIASGSLAAAANAVHVLGLLNLGSDMITSGQVNCDQNNTNSMREVDDMWQTSSNKPDGGYGDSAVEYSSHQFTEEEISELKRYGIQPTDSEAAATLSALHGELNIPLN